MSNNNSHKEDLEKLSKDIEKPFKRKIPFAQQLRNESIEKSKTIADRIMDEAKRLNDRVQRLYWYETIPYTDRKVLKQEGFTLTDKEDSIEITW